MKRLLAAGAPVDQANSNGATPLWVACQGGFAACAEHLLAAGARVDAPTQGGGTALLAAIAGNQVECVRVLLRAGADAAGYFEGTNLMDWAVELGAHECVAVLREEPQPKTPVTAETS